MSVSNITCFMNMRVKNTKFCLMEWVLYALGTYYTDTGILNFERC